MVSGEPLWGEHFISGEPPLQNLVLVLQYAVVGTSRKMAHDMINMSWVTEANLPSDQGLVPLSRFIDPHSLCLIGATPRSNQ